MITTENLYIRLLEDNDFNYLKLLWKEDTQLGGLYQSNPEEFGKILWDATKNTNDEVYLIFKKDSHDFCGKIELQKKDDDCIELGMALLDKHQNQGIGTEAVKGFGQWLHEVKGLSEIIACVDPENKRSQHVLEKLGAKFIGQKSGLSKSVEEFLCRFDENLDLDAIGSYFYKLSLPIK